MILDLEVLFKKPDLDAEALLIIEPLAPLSMVSTLPGSYYKSLDMPTKANLCGMFENILGWHIGQKDRKAIWKAMMKVYKKSYRITEVEETTSAVGYTSLLGHLFKVELPIRPPIVCRYDDIWKQQRTRKDGDVHPKGTPNISYELMPIRSNYENITGEEFDLSKFYSKYIDKYPMYYTSKSIREFVVFDQCFEIKLKINSQLLNQLRLSIDDLSPSYLGTNEGWVSVKINQL